MFFHENLQSEIKKNLSREHLNLLMIAEKADVDIQELIDYAKKENIEIVGGLFPGVMHQHVNSEEGIILKHLYGHHALLQDIHNTERLEIPAVANDFESAIVFVDGLTTSIAAFLEKMYETYYDNMHFIGGGCGSLSLRQQPCIFNKEGIFQDAALIIYLKQQLSLGVNHGWEKIAGPFVVSASSGNVIEELNWQPAFDVYQDVINQNNGIEIREDNFFDIAKGFPFGIYREGMEDVVRDPIITNENSLTCVGEVAPNSVVHILSGDNQKLIEGAKKAAETSLSNSCEDVLVVDCISRVLYEEAQFKEELVTVQEVIHHNNPNISLEGVLSLGEISSYGDGYLEFFNKTIVVGSFQS